jgi:hypothetical protein
MQETLSGRNHAASAETQKIPHAEKLLSNSVVISHLRAIETFVTL